MLITVMNNNNNYDNNDDADDDGADEEAAALTQLSPGWQILNNVGRNQLPFSTGVRSVFSNMVMAPASHRGWEGQARKAGQQASG
jgi:hypothetical protein